MSTTPVIRPYEPGTRYRWQPAAEEMILFRAGSMEDPEPLLRHLLDVAKTYPDALYRIELLAGRCLAEIHPEKLRAMPELVEGILQGLKKAASVLETKAVGNAFAFPAGLRWLIESLKNRPPTGYPPLRWLVIQAGKTGIPDELLTLLSELLGKKQPTDVRKDAVYILRELGRVAGTATLSALTEMLADPDDSLRWDAVSAINSFGDAAGTPGFLSSIASLLDGTDTTIRLRAFSALSGLSPHLVTNEILDIVSRHLQEGVWIDRSRLFGSWPELWRAIPGDHSIGDTLAELRNDPRDGWRISRALRTEAEVLDDERKSWADNHWKIVSKGFDLDIDLTTMKLNWQETLQTLELNDTALIEKHLISQLIETNDLFLFVAIKDYLKNDAADKSPVTGSR